MRARVSAGAIFRRLAFDVVVGHEETPGAVLTYLQVGAGDDTADEAPRPGEPGQRRGRGLDRKGNPDIGAKRRRVRAGGEHHGVRLERAVRQNDPGDTAVRAGERLHFGLLDEPCTRLYRGTDEGQSRGDRVKRSLARGMGRDRRRRGESWLEATDLVLLDEPHVVAPGGVLGDGSLRLGRFLGPGESAVPVDRERTAQLAIQATVVRDREVPKLREDGGVAVDDVDPRERARRHARSRPRALDYRHRRARGREMVGKRRADNPGPHDDDRRTPGH